VGGERCAESETGDTHVKVVGPAHLETGALLVLAVAADAADGVAERVDALPVAEAAAGVSLHGVMSRKVVPGAKQVHKANRRVCLEHKGKESLGRVHPDSVDARRGALPAF
jgi:hypothetical protein